MMRRRLAPLLLAAAMGTVAGGAGAAADPTVRTLVVAETIGGFAVDGGRLAWSEGGPLGSCGARLRVRALSGVGATRSSPCFMANDGTSAVRVPPIAFAGSRVLWFEEVVGNTTYVGVLNVFDLRNQRSSELCSFEVDTNYGQRSGRPEFQLAGGGSLLAYAIDGQESCARVGAVNGDRAMRLDTQLTAVATLAVGGDRIAVGGPGRLADRSSIELRSARGALLRTLTVRGAVRGLSLSGALLAALVDQPANTIELFEVATGRRLQPLALPVNRVREVAVSGGRVAALTSGRTTSLYAGTASRMHRVMRVSVSAVSLDLDGSTAVWAEDASGVDAVRAART